jgi:phosphatidylglycerophosphate synthase
MAYSLDQVRVLAKREPFRAGVRMRYVMPRISVRVTLWILRHFSKVTPNQLTLLSAVFGVVAGGFLLFPRGIAAALAAMLLYQLHILFDFVDGDIARVKKLASPLGAYYDLMTGRLVKPVVIYSAVIGTWLGTENPTDAPRDLLLGTLILLGFFLDKEAVDVWYRANAGRSDIEDRYVVHSDRALKGARRRVVRALVGVRSIQALLVYQVIAAVLTTLGVHTVHLGPVETTLRGIVLMAYAVAFPSVALIRILIIARTGHIPRRQDLVDV